MEYINSDTFSGGKVKMQFLHSDTLYIMTKVDEKYKLFIVDNKNPKGKKIAESKQGEVLLERIPSYWG